MTLVEQVAPAHARSASGDVSRLSRCGHGDDFDDAFYTRSARRARDRWIEIGEEEGAELFVGTGAVWFDAGEDAWVARAQGLMAAHDIPVERLSPAEAAGLFPSLHTDDLAGVVFEPEAGVVRARDAVATLVARAVRDGATLWPATARPTATGAAEVDGAVLGADHTVWACGPWLGRLFPGHARVRAARQDLFYWGVPPAWRADRIPAWVDIPTGGYGFGDLDGAGMKAVLEEIGEDLDPQDGARISSPRIEAATRAFLARRFPALAGAPMIASRVMAYELTPDRHFLLARLPETDNSWLAGGGSGHGFKHGPAIGTYMADLLDGSAEPEERFAAGPRPERIAPLG